MTTTEPPGLAAVATYIDSELTYEWQRKTSFETRAFALVTANLGLVTLFFAISAQTRLLRHFATGFPHAALILTLLPIATSLCLAVCSAMPGNYSAPTVEAIRALQGRVFDRNMSIDQVTEEVVEARLLQLESAGLTNKRRARFSMASFIALAIAVLSLVISLTSAFLEL